MKNSYSSSFIRTLTTWVRWGTSYLFEIYNHLQFKSWFSFFLFWIVISQERTQELGLGKALPNKDGPVGYSPYREIRATGRYLLLIRSQPPYRRFLRSLSVIYQKYKQESCRSKARQQVFFRKLTKQEAGIKSKISQRSRAQCCCVIYFWTWCLPFCSVFTDGRTAHYAKVFSWSGGNPGVMPKIIDWNDRLFSVPV